MIEELNLEALVLDPREYVCSACNLVHWAPTGPSACG